MRVVNGSVVLTVLIALAGAPAAGKSKLAVLPTAFDKSSEGMVPKLFDEYVLSAVQNGGDYEVIGQDDIAALVGFEKQKDLVGCDDASCIANIGGALGVDRIIAVRIARLDADWVVTSKMINIKATRVEARTSDIVVGNVKALLNAVPDIVNKLFAAAQGRPPPPPLASSDSAPAPSTTARTDTRSDAERELQAELDKRRAVREGSKAAPAVAVSPTAAARAEQVGTPNPSLGRGARIGGMIMAWSGVGCAALSLMYGWVIDEASDSVNSIGSYGSTTDTSTDSTSGSKAGALVGGACMLLTGFGSGMYLNGKARASTGDDEAVGHAGVRFLGWILAAGGAIAPLALDSRGKILGVGALGLGLSAVVFNSSMAGGYATSRDREYPMVSMTLLEDVEHNRVPGAVLAASF